MPEPTEPLTPALIGRHFRTGYEAGAKLLHEWEQAKALLLYRVGQESLLLIRSALDPLPDHDLAGRKSVRAELVKQIEAALPAETEGIGVPQVNRWIRWAGACELLALDGDLAAPWGLKQAHLMVLERYVDQHEPTGAFRLKEPWKEALAGIIEALQTCLAGQGAATELESAIDALASVPESVQPVATPVPVAPKPEASRSASPRLAPAPTKPAPSPSKSNAPAPAPSPSPSASPKPEAPTSGSSTGPSPKDLADQAFKLLQQDEILAGVFRRDWEPAKVLAIVENLIRGCGEKSPNLLGLARAYHRMKPLVLTHFDEVVIDSKFKMTQKENPEPPTLEQLAPQAELATA